MDPEAIDPEDSRHHDAAFTVGRLPMNTCNQNFALVRSAIASSEPPFVRVILHRQRPIASVDDLPRELVELETRRRADQRDGGEIRLGLFALLLSRPVLESLLSEVRSEGV
jgi:hypothetical protein